MKNRAVGCRKVMPRKCKKMTSQSIYPLAMHIFMQKEAEPKKLDKTVHVDIDREGVYVIAVEGWRGRLQTSSFRLVSVATPHTALRLEARDVRIG